MIKLLKGDEARPELLTKLIASTKAILFVEAILFIDCKMSDKHSLSLSRLFFRPRCRQPFARIGVCSLCNILANMETFSYVEKLLETVLSSETNRARMAVDNLTKQFHQRRATMPLKISLKHMVSL